MGLCLPCFGSSSEDYDQPDHEERRRQAAEAAERRQKQQDAKGVKDPEALKRKQKKQEAAEKELQNRPSGGTGLSWQVG